MMIKRMHFLFYFLLLTEIFGMSQEYPGFRVKGRYLYDNCGERIMLRGVSYPAVWFQKDGNTHFGEIEKTGANVIRIVWDTQNSAADIDKAITNCRNLNMIPMVELHDATGDLSKLQQCVDYWTSNEVVDVILEHEEYLLINIANEAGDWAVTGAQFSVAYENAITDMRNAGIHVPLIIDASDWGKKINILQSEGPSLIDFDPDHNLMFSIHMWWPKMYGFTESDIVNEIKQSVDMKLPLIVGEFSQMHGECDEDIITSDNSIAYKTIIRECQLNQVGYIAWSWFGNCNPFWDMTTDGKFDNLYDWGLEVAVTDTNSISSTSVRPYSFIHGSCNPNQEEYPDDISEVKELFTDAGFTLEPITPNPFYSIAIINYSLPVNSFVKIAISDITGKEIITLVNSEQSFGNYSVVLNGDNMKPGFYYCSLRAGEYTKTQKIILIR
jgi:mannan endo-1,4-beta-mannosidase